MARSKIVKKLARKVRTNWTRKWAKILESRHGAARGRAARAASRAKYRRIAREGGGALGRAIKPRRVAGGALRTLSRSGRRRARGRHDARKIEKLAETQDRRLKLAYPTMRRRSRTGGGTGTRTGAEDPRYLTRAERRAEGFDIMHEPGKPHVAGAASLKANLRRSARRLRAKRKQHGHDRWYLEEGSRRTLPKEGGH